MCPRWRRSFGGGIDCFREGLRHWILLRGMYRCCHRMVMQVRSVAASLVSSFLAGGVGVGEFMFVNEGG